MTIDDASHELASCLVTSCVYLVLDFCICFLCSVVVVLAVKTYVYNFVDLTLIDCLDTCNNPNGLCALNSEGTCMLAIPHTEKGHVKVRAFTDQRVEAVIMCH